MYVVCNETPKIMLMYHLEVELGGLGVSANLHRVLHELERVGGRRQREGVEDELAGLRRGGDGNYADLDELAGLRRNEQI